MKHIDFCHIAPTKHLDLVKNRNTHLVLAHLIEQDEEYTEFYKQEKANGSTIIMDNSAFEMYKQGRPMYDSDKLIEMGEKVDADYIALSDYPDEHSSKTIMAAKELAPKVKDAGFGTFFIPQSKIGDLDDLKACFVWAKHSDLIDYIGLSILAIPNAYSVQKDNLLQRFVSRFMFMEELEKINYFPTHKKMHVLGMVDGPNEIKMLANWFQTDDLHTWDSSAAVWAGLNNITFDDSPTGLIYGKFEKEVDFSAEWKDPKRVAKAQENMHYIDGLFYDYQV